MNDMIQIQMLKEQLKSKHETNHILHLILCIPTMGFWLPVWFLVALTNGRKRSEVDDRFEEMELQSVKDSK